MLYIVAGRRSGCGAGSVLVRAAVVRFFDDARFFPGFGFAADFFLATRPVLRFIRFGDLRFLDMQLTLRMHRSGSVDGDLGQGGERRGLPLDGRENELARAFGQIEGESGLMALG